MPTYAILGATGKTGNALITNLLLNPSNKINAYIRSKSKLLSQFPSISQNASVSIFEGPIDNIPQLAACLSNVDIIFNVLGQNESIPGMRVAQDGAQAIVAALCHLGLANGSEKVPKLITLSSCSINQRMYENEPVLMHWLIHAAFSHAYDDLELAEKYLRLHASWLKVTFIQPGGLVEDKQRGHALSLDRKGAKGFVGYLDLAAGMIEVAEAGKFDGLGVSVVATSKDVKFEWAAPKQAARGLVWHFAPSLGWIAKYVRLF